jgi:hypothetical protein
MLTFDFCYLDENWDTLFIHRRQFKDYRTAYMHRNSELLNKPVPQVFTIQIRLVKDTLAPSSGKTPGADSNYPDNSLS